MKNIGIIGGMGPLATADLFKKIIENTDANKDQDHIPVLIYNYPQVPDRTNSILYKGESPVDSIVFVGEKLVEMGADFLLLPCNTSFYYYEEFSKRISKPVVNMIDLTIDEIKNISPKKVCILATEGTTRSEIYTKKLSENSINYYEIDDRPIKMLSDLIYKVVKAKKFDYDISEFTNELDRIVKEEEVDLFVLACTELPILFEKYELEYNTIDPTLLLAKEGIRLALE